MTELLPPDGLALAAICDELFARLSVRDGLRRDSRLVFYDTFDGLFRAAGLTFCHADGELILESRHGAQVRAWLRLVEPPDPPLFAHDLPAGSLRDAVQGVVGVRALLVLARVRNRERLLDILDAERKTVVRMALAEPQLVGPARPGALRPRVRVAAVRGYDKPLRRVLTLLEDKLGMPEIDQPLVDEAVLAAGGVPGGVSAKVAVPLHVEDRADTAGAVVLQARLAVIEANLQGVIADVDSEFLHDFRTSLRRSRAVLRQLGAVFPPEELQRFRADLRWLQVETGEARDLDVYLLEFDVYEDLVGDEMRTSLAPLRAVLGARRAAAYRRMVAALKGERAVGLLAAWGSFLLTYEGAMPAERPAGAPPIGAVAGERIAKLYRRMLRLGCAISDESPPGSLHELRKVGKELRYMLELFAVPLFAPEVVRPMVRSLKALQDVLGRFQDREVQVATLSSVRQEVASRPAGAEALMAMGVLVSRLHADSEDARAHFSREFSQFASKQQQELVAETFGGGRDGSA